MPVMLWKKEISYQSSPVVCWSCSKTAWAIRWYVKKEAKNAHAYASLLNSL